MNNMIYLVNYENENANCIIAIATSVKNAKELINEDIANDKAHRNESNYKIIAYTTNRLTTDKYLELIQF